MRKQMVLGTVIAVMFLASACSKASDNEGNTNGAANASQPSANADAGSTSGDAGAGNGDAGKTDTQAADPYGKYDATVTIKIAQDLPSGDKGLPAGQTVEDNAMTQFYEKNLNIKLSRDWSAVDGDPYDQKAMLAIASRELPDAMQVNEEQLRLMVKAGLLEDLTDTYDNYASSMVKKLQDGGAALDSATFDGKLYGIPSINIKGDAVTVLWIRKDWLDKLGLQPPKTRDDVAKIAKAFIDNKMGGPNTIGLTGPITDMLSDSDGNRAHGFDAIFASYNSYPRNWVKDDKGNVVYGSIQPQTKDALATLRDWYSQGLIDKQFFLRENPDESYINGQGGMFFGPWWMGWGNIGDSFKQNPDAQWVAYPGPVDDNGNLNTHMQPPSRDYMVVRKGFEHPEALMKGINLTVGVNRHATDLPDGVQNQWDTTVQNTNIDDALNIFRVNMDDTNAVSTRRHAILDALNGKVDPATLEPDAKQAYDYAKKYVKDPATDTLVDKYYPQADKDGLNPTTIGGFQAYIVGGAPLDNKYNEVSSLLYSPTATMKSRWANLTKMENETFLKIVIGEAPLDSFDTFVKDWKAQGGDTITKEVEAAIKQ
ncbi:extracellular solute-binding protein [Paenibacillus sp. MWE-103]|uniref:Extracellular solute-binding protein n=1 Tax=Paenibacillus artemisiicola TaxID=1172618 RepID=A0ABS3W5E8_9BACL|nr:extracellular solute-binding protein [Paenibacillus artemisiicola]MBO7743524.1 extracellular solute-binding protein [Paenibacillus artemisiicola]